MDCFHYKVRSDVARCVDCDAAVNPDRYVGAEGLRKNWTQDEFLEHKIATEVMRLHGQGKSIAYICNYISSGRCREDKQFPEVNKTASSSTIDCVACRKQYTVYSDMINDFDFMFKAMGWIRRSFHETANPWFCSEKCAFHSEKAKYLEECWK